MRKVLKKLRFYATPFCVTLFFALRVPVLFAQESAEREIPVSGRAAEPEGRRSPSGPITSIEMSGLKRTKPHIARYPLEQFLGRDAETLDLNDVYAAMKEMGTLEPVKVELAETDDGLVLRVEVQEKWSFFPVPLLMGGSGELSGGLFLADANAFGLRDQAAIGGMYGSSGIIAVLYYNHTPNRQGSVGWNAAFVYNRRESENVDRNERLHRRYLADRFYSSLGLYYPFTKLITGSASISYSNFILRNSADAFNQPERDAVHLGFSPGLVLRSSSWDGYLLSQRSLSLEYSYNFALTGSPLHELDFRVIYEKSLIPGFRVNVRSGVVWNSGSDPLFEEGSNRAQVDILPSKFSARHYAGLSAGLEKHLLKARWGTLSILSSWQGVFSQGPLSENEVEFNHGPSGGIRFYLSRLAIPAFGASLAYNVNTGIYRFSFSIGMSF